LARMGKDAPSPFTNITRQEDLWRPTIGELNGRGRRNPPRRLLEGTALRCSSKLLISDLISD
jgi:hypothetical protein